MAVQLKTFTAEGNGDKKAEQREHERRVDRLARHEHVVAPHQEPEHRDAEARERHERVPEHRLAAECGDELADHPIAGSTMM